MRIKTELESLVKKITGTGLGECTPAQMQKALCMLIKDKCAERGYNSGERKLYYFSAEFLVGKLMSNNLINLGLYDEVRNVLAEYGMNLAKVEEAENEPSLGNGGLGRLAACFLDSIATLGLCGDGIGLGYHFGLFRQYFRNNLQCEEKDEWLTDVSWLQRQKRTYTVRYGMGSVQSVLYDVDVTGYKSKCNRLHLFDIESIDETLVEEGITFNKEDISHNLTLFLYPDDSDEAGRKLRIYQQYFMVSCGAAYILDELREAGHGLRTLPEHVVIQINDTHPSMVIPELIRRLMEEGIEYDEAVTLVRRTCAYTNHTILAEALETWPISCLEEVVPQLVPIIRKLDEQARTEAAAATVTAATTAKATAIIDSDDDVHMAHMDIHFGFSVNGVAALHTEILKKQELKAFHALYPGKFNNKTNGITFRRWLMYANPELTSYIRELIGDEFMTDASKLEELLRFQEENEVLDRLAAIKKQKKEQLCEYLMKTQHIAINKESIFDIQIKRMHEYKRQQMNALYIIYRYLGIKRGSVPGYPVTMIFGAKAAPAYTIAKDIIHLLLCLRELVNNDPDVNPYLNIVIVENYNVTLAEKLIPACDISEQISLASKEASGTGNMKLMLNGAVTLGTEDGANVEIHELVGDENIYIFGDTADTVMKRYEVKSYRPLDYYLKDDMVKELVDFIAGRQLLGIGDADSLLRLHRELLIKDWFMTFPDLRAFIETRERAYTDYCNRREWAGKMLVNTAKSGYFSSDRTISEYNEYIWHL